MHNRTSQLTLVVACLALALAAASFFGPHSTWAERQPAPQAVTTSPTIVSYQGRVLSGGQAFNGTGYFKFALINAVGTTSYWSNNGSSTAGSEPTSAVPLTVTQGLFNVMLGDTALSGMTSALSASVFADNDRRLRVWFSNNGTTFELLTPDQRLAAVPFALNAETLDGLDSAAFQQRVSGTCAVGNSIRAIAANGTVTCDAPTTFYYPLYRPQVLDLTTVDPALKGFVGGFSDGRYGYFVPQNDGAIFGKVARVDLQNFAVGGVTVLDLTTVDAVLKGFWGGFTDGRYGYFVPLFNGKVARVNLQNFTTGGVTVLDLTTVDPDLKGFYSGFSDGRYGYFVPQNFGKVARVDLQNFTTGGVTVLDLTTVDAALKGFAGGFTDGRYGYFVPLYNGALFGKVARVDLQNFTTGGVTVLDLTTVDAALKGFTGGFTDGRYGYFVPDYNGAVARVDLQNFTTGGVTVLDLTTVDTALRGFVAGFTDGRYGYFVPYENSANVRFGKVARVDLQNFTAGGVTVLDLTTVDPDLKGFYGGFTDGRYGYFVPYHNGSVYLGKVVRIQLFFGGGAP